VSWSRSIRLCAAMTSTSAWDDGSDNIPGGATRAPISAAAAEEEAPPSWFSGGGNSETEDVLSALRPEPGIAFSEPASATGPPSEPMSRVLSLSDK